jgi:hypothetical protein
LGDVAYSSNCFPGSAAFSFSSAFIVARTNSRPGTKTILAAKPAHVYTRFGNQHCGTDNIKSGNGLQKLPFLFGGAAVIVPVCPEKLDLQGNFMAGQGIGRYGSTQLPDLAFTPTGYLKLLTGYSAMVGAVGHPTPAWDTYLYAGYEGVDRENYKLAGTLTPAYNYTDIGYGDEGLTVGQQQTSNVWQLTGGVWDRIYQGAFGKVQLGFQYSLTSREAFSSTAGSGQHAYENIFMTSFRYYPL